MYDKHFVGLDLTGVQNNGVQRPISRVTLLLDDDNAITAGDDTGMELTTDCPHATQAMANAILAQVKGLRYQMFSADDTRLDPAAELGDGVTAGGIYSVISTLSDDGSGYPSLSAPGEAELEDEYPSVGPMTQSFNRKIAQTNSRITKTAEQIRLEVANEVAGLSSSITVELNKITQEVKNTEKGLSSKIEQTASSLQSEIAATDGRVSTISQTVNSITSRVTGLEGNYSSLEQKVDSFKLTVSNGSTSSTISLKAGNATISSETIEMNGLVTFSGLSSGTTTIDGACIKTGTIDANRLNLTGQITFSDMDYSTQVALNAAMTADSWRYGNSTYIDGSNIMTGTVKSSNLQGQYVYLEDWSGNISGYISITGAQTAQSAIDLTSYGALRFTAISGAVYIDSNAYGTHIEVYDKIYTRGNLVSSNMSSLGDSYYRWSDVYANNATIQTSDLTAKAEVEYGLDRYDALFDALRPMSFLFKDGESGRRHLGMGAQDVEKAMAECGVSDMEFAGLIRSPKKDGNGYDYGLRYGEFIPMCIEQIQRLKRRVDRLERECHDE